MHRLLSSMKSMPVNAEPQLIISVCGPHRAGALKDISSQINIHIKGDNKMLDELRRCHN